MNSAALKPGLYIYHILTGCWDYIPVPTGNNITLRHELALPMSRLQ